MNVLLLSLFLSDSSNKPYPKKDSFGNLGVLLDIGNIEKVRRRQQLYKLYYIPQHLPYVEFIDKKKLLPMPNILNRDTIDLPNMSNLLNDSSSLNLLSYIKTKKSENFYHKFLNFLNSYVPIRLKKDGNTRAAFYNNFYINFFDNFKGKKIGPYNIRYLSKLELNIIKRDQGVNSDLFLDNMVKYNDCFLVFANSKHCFESIHYIHVSEEDSFLIVIGDANEEADVGFNVKVLVSRKGDKEDNVYYFIKKPERVYLENVEGSLGKIILDFGDVKRFLTYVLLKVDE